MNGIKNEYILSGGPLPENYTEGCRSLGEFILKRLDAIGDSVVLINASVNETITATELKENSIHMAILFQRSGIKEGDTILLASENTKDFAFILFGAIYIGARVAFLEPNYLKEQFIHMILDTQPKFIFCSYSSIENVRKVVHKFNFIQKIIFFGCNWNGDEVINYNDWLLTMDKLSINNFECPPLDMNESVAIILQTSGTTSMPKNILVTQTNLLASIIHYTKHGSTPNPIAFSCVSWVHGIGVKMLFKYTLNNVKYAFLTQYTDREFLRAIQKYEINIAWVHQKIIAFLCQDAVASNYNLTSLRILYSGGTALTINQSNKLNEKFPNVIIRQIYGMVELSYVTHQTDKYCKKESVGILQPGLFGKVIDIETGHLLGPNRLGEFCFKGSMVMKGYIGDTQMNSVIDDDGWFHSGDIGYYDTDAEWYLLGRKSDIIFYDGRRVFPIFIENILMKIHGVREVSAVGIPNRDFNQTLVVFVVKDLGAGDNELRNQILDKVTNDIQIQLCEVVFVKELPKSPVVGKVLKTYLRQYCTQNCTNKNILYSPFYLKWYNNNKP